MNWIKEEFNVDGKNCIAYMWGKPGYLLLQPVDEHDIEALGEEMDILSAKADEGILFVAFQAENWNDELSPWAMAAVFGKEGFGGSAGETLLFLDEIQNCPRAITALKYFCENKQELHVICAGSLLGVAIRREHISFPVGKVNRLQLYPMSFKEFVIASGRKNLIEILGNWPTDRAVPDLYAVPMKKMLKDYYIVGGMPEAVQTWLDTHDYDEVTEVQREILKDYGDDFTKYAPIKDVPKIRWIWDSIPVQLAKENNKFVFSHVKAGKRSAELEDSLQWLSDAGLITQCFMVEKPELPLAGFADRTYFKVYMSDLGLLRVRSGLSAETILDETGMYARFKGAFSENYVFNELVSVNKEPYFWRSGNTAEVDFIYEDQARLIPVEVKAADNTQAKSYKQFCKKYQPEFGF